MAAAGPSRPNSSRHWLDVPDRGHGDHFSYRRQPFSPDEDFDRRYIERHVIDPYNYDDCAHGVKRPFYAVVSFFFFSFYFFFRTFWYVTEFLSP